MKKLSYQLNKSAESPLYLQLYQQIKQAIHHQELALGSKLPSKRQLCDYLQISQNTVESAYNQLIAEGYIEAQPRRGFFVCFQAELSFPLQKNEQNRPLVKPERQVKFDFNPNKIDSRHFPWKLWQKCARFQRNIAQQQQCLALGDKQGDLELREQIANYLAASRGVRCEAEQIVIGAGVESCVQQLILLFNHCYPQRNFRYAMERYGYAKVEKLLHLYGKSVIKFPLEMDFSQLAQDDLNVAYLTPSHLYPFGQVLTISQRQQLLEWAGRSAERYIIEDDYDSEFRYQGKPIPALQSLDYQDKVIYLGSFSKLLMPSLRLSFMVLPKTLLVDYQHCCDFFHSPVSRFEQQRLAQFIQSGELEKHIHRMRKIYRSKMVRLCELLAPHRQKIAYYGEHSGFYLLIELLNEPRSQQQLTTLAAQRDIQLYPVDYQGRKLFSLGFGDLSEEELSEAVGALLAVWGIGE
ncbi:GntR family transcriptional regulator [Rodentibacter caecimuris]|uniref:GntR family transcriptional regulator n=1 Tax=Rodentibacter caecimuris TaxID=1796644 RepID=A0A1V3KL96_9PAST|nr:PLP-dependent aminotransferase family protein [Rodentibacter heylii]OOF78424.1 GntR family transcriptional regulator [Rodentibacter heylii]